MVPLEAETLEDLVSIALINIDRFDHARFEVWRRGRSGGIPKLADVRPPDKLYRVVSDDEREGRGAPQLLGVVVGYLEAQRGAPALCMMQILGIKTGAGSSDLPIGVPAEALEDVTTKARAGKLRF